MFFTRNTSEGKNSFGKINLKIYVAKNVNGYWKSLLQLIDNQISEGFVLSNNKNFFTVVENIDELETKLIQSLS